MSWKYMWAFCFLKAITTVLFLFQPWNPLPQNVVVEAWLCQDTQGLALHGPSASFPLRETTAFSTSEVPTASPHWRTKVNIHIFNHAWKYLFILILFHSGSQKNCSMAASVSVFIKAAWMKGLFFFLREWFEMTWVLNCHYFALTWSLCVGAFFPYCVYICFNNLML